MVKNILSKGIYLKFKYPILFEFPWTFTWNPTYSLDYSL